MKFQPWIDYFQSNRSHTAGIIFEGKPMLSASEKRIIQVSISRFQLGESSPGKRFIRKSCKLNDPSYTLAVRYFVKEEQDHALVLGKFLEQENMYVRRHDWIDSAFRAARNFNNLFQTVHILLMAEILAMNYYAALKRCTRVASLQAICAQLLRDEVRHIQFQSMALREIYRKQSPLMRLIYSLYRSLSFYIAMCCFYLIFFKIMETGNISFVQYVKRSVRHFRFTQNIMKGKIDPQVSAKNPYVI